MHILSLQEAQLKLSQIDYNSHGECNTMLSSTELASSNTCKNKSTINFPTFIFEHKRITRQGISMQVHFIVMGVIVQMKY